MRASGDRSSDFELATACSMEVTPVVASVIERLAEATASSDFAANTGADKSSNTHAHEAKSPSDLRPRPAPLVPALRVAVVTSLAPYAHRNPFRYTARARGRLAVRRDGRRFVTAVALTTLTGHPRRDLFVEADRRALFEGCRHATLFVSDDLERQCLAFHGGERMARTRFEVVTLQVREDPVPAALKLEQYLYCVIAGRNRSTEDRNFLLLGERAAVVGLVVLDGPIQNEERAHQLEGARHVVLELNLRAGTGEPAGQDGVGQEREARVAAADLLFQLVDALLEVAQANGVGCAVH